MLTRWNGRTQIVLLALLATLFLNVTGDWKKFGFFDGPPIPFELTESAEEVEDDHPEGFADCLLHDSLLVDACCGTRRSISSPRICLPSGHTEAPLSRGPPA